jgi:two-component system phosphate regulon response regulator PhoB
MGARVSIVGSEIATSGSFADRLREAGLDVVTHGDGESLLRAATVLHPGVLVVDQRLPDVTGVDLARRIRRTRETREIPFILCSTSEDEIDRVIAFEIGVDDYVVKPFSARELVLRVQALHRRYKTSSAPDKTFLTVGMLEIDVPRHAVSVSGETIDLTAIEFRLLLDLAMRRGRVQRRDELLERVWRVEGEYESRTVDTHVKRLRDKLGTAGEIIETVRGVGYRLRDAS